MTKRAREAEEMRKKKLVRLRFRCLIRSVVFNRIWLMDQGEQKLSLNVKKNIAMLVRTQRKIGMLTLAEKALIRTHQSLRSVEERKKLVTLLTGLTCFSKIPPKVRARLVPVIKFLYLGSGRTLIKEGHQAITVFFLLSGEVEVTKKTFDHLKNDYVDKVESICGPGDTIGDTEMYENCRRKATYTTTTDVELLVVYEDEFNQILRPIMSTQWFERKRAMLALEYFNYLTEDQITSACKLGVIQQFNPLESIYYEDKGPLSYVHFVISGECMILQCLKMKVTQKNGKKSFELVNISKGGSDLFLDLTNNEILKKLKEEHLMDKKENQNDLEIDEDDEKIRKQSTALKPRDMKSIERACALLKSTEEGEVEGLVEGPVEEEEEEEENEPAADVEIEEMWDGNAELSDTSEVVGKSSSNPIDFVKAYEDQRIQSKKLITRGSVYSMVSSRTKTEMNDWDDKKFPSQSKERRKIDKRMLKVDRKILSGNTVRAVKAEQPKQQEQLYQPEQLEQPASQEQPFEAIKIPIVNSKKESSSEKLASEEVTIIESTHMTPDQSKINLSCNTNVLAKIENHFIDVGSLTFGGIFGLGEKLEHRVIMARTTVQCFLIPRFWLFEKEHNPGNIWQRKRFYLDTTIPSRQTLFQDFLTTRKWQQFKNDLIASNLNPNSNANPTKLQDVPIMCRIMD